MKFIRNMLFNTGRYPSTMGAGGQQDLDFCRYLEWMWFKRCFALLGFAFALGAGGLYVGMYHAEYVTETAIWAWGVAWIYILAPTLGAIAAVYFYDQIFLNSE